MKRFIFLALSLLLTQSVWSSPTDTDEDGIQNESDNCPLTWNSDQSDLDSDGVGDVCDNCLTVPNASQCNTNPGVVSGRDKIGNHCDADLDNNNTVNSFDLSIMRDNFGASGPNDSDLDCNGIVNSFDLVIMRNQFGLAPGPSGNATVKLMPIGDSITEGTRFRHTYRYYLSQMYPGLDLVGSKVGVQYGNTPLDPNFDQDHEAYWGWNADQVEVMVDAAADIYVPDVALIHLGTNDILDDETIESTEIDLQNIVQDLRDANPAVAIFIAEIIFCNHSGCSEREDLNNAIVALAPALNTVESPVVSVSMDSLTASDLYDAFHPTSEGSQKMASNWEAALISAGVVAPASLAQRFGIFSVGVMRRPENR